MKRIPHALEREVFEETGIIVRVKSLVGIYSNIRKPSIVNMDFICEYVSGELTTSEESTQVEWVDSERSFIPSKTRSDLQTTKKYA